MKRIVIFLCMVFLLLGWHQTRASFPLIYIRGLHGAIEVDSGFSLAIAIDSDQLLNAYSISLNYDPTILNLISLDDSHSLIDVWPRQPTVTHDGRIKFSGGSLSPFKGIGGELLTMHFMALKEGEAALGFTNPSFYAADGKGSKIIPKIKNFTVSISKRIVASSTADAQKFLPRENEDGVPPVIKEISLVADPFNPKQKLLGFLVSDTGSGIKETRIRSRSYAIWSDWVPTQNPAAIPTSVWSIELKVIDNQGNITRKTIYDFSAGWKFFLAVAIILVSLLGGSYWFLFSKKNYSK